MKKAYIKSISYYLPDKVVTNEELVADFPEWTVEKIADKVGVKERHVAVDSETATDLAVKAAEKLFAENLEITKDSIDFIVFCTQSPDYLLPTSACLIQERLGLRTDIGAFDFNLGCSGWVYAMSVALSLMTCGRIKRAIVLAGDARKQVPEEHDQLFGYAGTATALEYDEKAKPITIDLGSDGTEYDAIIRPGGGARNPITPASLELQDCEDGRKRHACQTRMNGMDVFAFGITTAPKSIKKVFAECGITMDGVDYVLFHQANIKMLETIKKKLKLTDEKVPYSLRRFGNTSSASIPLTVVTELREHLCGKAVTLVGCGFGVGLSWGTILFHTDENLVISELQEL